MSDTHGTAVAEPEVGSYFVANYPPFSVWTPRGRRARRAARRSHAAAGRRAAGAVPAHPVLPEALPFLLLPRLHGQERPAGRAVPRPARRASGSCCARSAALAGRPLDFVYFGGGTPSFLSTRQLETLVDAPDGASRRGRGRGDHVRVRAGHADRGEARGHPAARRHAAQPRRRELRRRHPRAERPRASLARDRPRRIDVRAIARLPADQHRPDRRHARRDRRELAALHRAHARRSSRTA